MTSTQTSTAEGPKMAEKSQVEKTPPAASLRAKQLDFKKEKLNIVQIGLGTNSTFVQNLAGDDRDWDRTINWLLKLCSECTPGKIRGLAIEPVIDHVESLKEPLRSLPGVDLVQVAIGEHDRDSSELQVLKKEHHDDMLKKATSQQQDGLRWNLEYLLNMSHFVDEPMPAFDAIHQHINDSFDIQVPLQTQRTATWSWQTLVAQCNFRGCEVLMVDTEGFDARILRSLVRHCRENPAEWPTVIQFESMGHCDVVDGPGTEKQTIELLQANDYTLLSHSGYNTQLIRMSGMPPENVASWLWAWKCSVCKRRWAWPYCCDRCGERCEDCASKALQAASRRRR